MVIPLTYQQIEIQHGMTKYTLSDAKLQAPIRIETYYHFMHVSMEGATFFLLMFVSTMVKHVLCSSFENE